jgi:hypothetical protein
LIRSVGGDFFDLLVCWCRNWSDINSWVFWLFFLCNEGCVLADRLRGTFDVLVAWCAVDDLVVDHVGKVLQTVEHNMFVFVVYDFRVVAFTSVA